MRKILSTLFTFFCLLGFGLLTGCGGPGEVEIGQGHLNQPPSNLTTDSGEKLPGNVDIFD